MSTRMSMPDLGMTTHAARHPELGTQESRHRPKVTTVQKATRKLGHDARKQKEALLSDAIGEFVSHRDTMIDKIATTHSKTTAYINKIINTAPAHKIKRKPNLHNAISHFKSLNNNGMHLLASVIYIYNAPEYLDLPPGHRATLQELQRMGRDDPNLKDMSTSQEQVLIDALVEHRDFKRIGARPSNRAAALDTRFAVDKLNTEVCCLNLFSTITNHYKYLDGEFIPTHRS